MHVSNKARLCWLGVAAVSGFANASGAAGCKPLDYVVMPTGPAQSIISWVATPGAVGYVVDARGGATPERREIDLAPQQNVIAAELDDLVAGQAYDVDICEAMTDDACPGGPAPDACVTSLHIVGGQQIHMLPDPAPAPGGITRPPG